MTQPNLFDKRTQQRIKKALGFASSTFNATTSREWAKVGNTSSDKSIGLDTYFGQQQNAVSKLLRSILLITHDDFFRFNSDKGSKCKEYRLNELGVRYLCEILGRTTTLTWDQYKEVAEDYIDITTTKLPIVLHLQKTAINEFVDQEYGYQLTSGMFLYTHKSNRLWNSLQSVKKEFKKPILARYGYTYQYDVEACAPTLIYQFAKKVGLTKPTPALTEFLTDRSFHRIALSELLQIDLKDAKTIITALFSGAKFGPRGSISTILKDDIIKLKRLQSCTFIIELRKDIKKCWDAIKLDLGKKTAMSSKDKWNIYFMLEEEVMDVVRAYLKKNNNLHFCEHDGWTSRDVIDDIELKSLIRSKTGYDVRFSLEMLSI